MPPLHPPPSNFSSGNAIMNILNPTAPFPRETITGNNYSPINTIITWILLVSTFLAVPAKIAVFRTRRRRAHTCFGESAPGDTMNDH